VAGQAFSSFTDGSDGSWGRQARWRGRSFLLREVLLLREVVEGRLDGGGSWRDGRRGPARSRGAAARVDAMLGVLIWPDAAWSRSGHMRSGHEAKIGVAPGWDALWVILIVAQWGGMRYA
jgi:hypothetical protein